MLEKMKETIDFVMNAKDSIWDENVLETIIIAAAFSLTNDYIFLIPNEKNMVDAKGLQHIDGAQVMIAENYHKSHEFGVTEVLNDSYTTEQAIDIFKKNSIIVEYNVDHITEYVELARVAEELTAMRSQYFLKRYVTHLSWKNSPSQRRDLSNFWAKATNNDSFQIINIDFDLKDIVLSVKHQFSFDPKPLFKYERAVHVVNDLAHQISKHVKIDSLVGGFKSTVAELIVDVDAELDDIVDVNRSYISNYADKEGVYFNLTKDKAKCNQVISTLRFNIPFKDFMDRIVSYYENRIKL